MHTPNRISETLRRRVIPRLVAGLAVACALTIVMGARDAAYAGEPLSETPAVQAFVSPVPPDGVRGWRGTVTHVRLLPRASGTVYYCWDQPIGVWEPADEEIIVPEGKHVLYATLVGKDAEKQRPWLAIPFKVEYDTPVRAVSPAIRAAGSGTNGTVTVNVTVSPHPGAIIKRIGGEDRYRTSQLISYENFTGSDTVILATGLNFADALTASGLAGCTNAPVLLVKSVPLTQTLLDEIMRLGASRVIIVGGSAAVPESVRTTLVGKGLTVRRIGGVDRYETASLIGREVLGYGQNGGRVYVARGDDFADALSLGPLAYRNKAPLLLVKPTTVPSSTRSLLSASAFSSGCIAGGTVAVSPRVAAEIDSYVGSVSRLAGETRYSTAVAVAAWGVGSGLVSYESIGIATGTVFADALCGGVAIGSRGGVILLTKPSELVPETTAAIEASASIIREVQVYGGVVAVYEIVVDRLGQILL